MNIKGQLNIFLLLALALCSAATSAASGLPEFRDIVRKNSPAVVKIIVEQRTASSGRARPGDGQIPEELRRFFEFRGAPPSGQERMGMGSGFIISQDGFILTNNHVVDGADSVLVRMSDRSEFDAEIIGTDPRSDLALLRINASDLPTVKLAQGDDLEVGEWVWRLRGIATYYFCCRLQYLVHVTSPSLRRNPRSASS